jgi:uncharacterized protein YqjF (DUF2071 family)
MQKPFLTARWRKLVMANYAVNPSILEKYMPTGATFDLWQGQCLVSLVGFMFEDTRLLGIKVPFHSNFEEVNLRFYIKFGDKRATVFVKEIVPKFAISWVANGFYGEQYETLRTKHHIVETEQEYSIRYEWKKQRWHSIALTASNELTAIEPHSEEEFITEHYWGYTKLNSKKTSEYEVRHPRWQQYKILDYQIDADFGLLYGRDFASINASKPVSILLAEGSSIEVMPRNVIRF